MDPQVRCRGLTRRYGNRTVLDDLDLEIFPGELCALLGANGAGKSTAVRILCTLSRPHTGTGTVAGHDVRQSPRAVRRHIGVVFQEPTLDQRLTVQENIRLHGVLYGLSGRRLQTRMSEVLALVGLEHQASAPVDTLSGGTARRLEIARALLHEPDVLFLDEPTTGLDPAARVKIWDDVRRLRREKGICVLLTTHYLAEAETADRVVLLREGRVTARGTPSELKGELGRDVVVLCTPSPEAVAQTLSRSGWHALPDKDGVEVSCADGEAALPTLITTAGAEITRARVRTRSLDDVFMRYAEKG
ncbi:MAG: type transport system ATP-binding protein [Actinomycetota bacterium]|nr:type transport system ATP-binding protein [Actinomycetota bacterium]